MLIPLAKIKIELLIRQAGFFQKYADFLPVWRVRRIKSEVAGYLCHVYPYCVIGLQMQSLQLQS